MVVSAWSNGAGTFGIRVGILNREKFFERDWRSIDVEIDGVTHGFRLTGGFWNQCPEFRDTGAPIIQEWLKRNGKRDWRPEPPPQFTLTPLGGTRFRLDL